MSLASISACPITCSFSFSCYGAKARTTFSYSIIMSIVFCKSISFVTTSLVDVSPTSTPIYTCSSLTLHGANAPLFRGDTWRKKNESWWWCLCKQQQRKKNHGHGLRLIKSIKFIFTQLHNIKTTDDDDTLEHVIVILLLFTLYVELHEK
jgi:hypothetical protein